MAGMHRHFVVARENAGQHDRGVGRLGLHDAQDGLQAPGDIRSRSPGRIANVVRARQQNDDLGIHSVQFAVVETPEDVLDLIGAPSEIGRIPTEEILFPIGQQLGIIRGPPAARNGIALEIDVDATLPGFLQ